MRGHGYCRVCLFIDYLRMDGAISALVGLQSPVADSQSNLAMLPQARQKYVSVALAGHIATNIWCVPHVTSLRGQQQKFDLRTVNATKLDKIIIRWAIA